jgi:anti-sigma factor RsiW
MTCDREAQVHAYHDRQLGPAAREAFEAHLAECAPCGELLADLRAVSRLVASTPLPEVSHVPVDRYYAAWGASRQRGLLRISTWLTGAAAAVLVGSLVLLPPKDPRPNGPQVAVADAGAWEAVALMPPPERRGDRPDQYVELAQWIADDLSDAGLQQR